jgi:hypothetical protein
VYASRQLFRRSVMARRRAMKHTGGRVFGEALLQPPARIRQLSAIDHVLC